MRMYAYYYSFDSTGVQAVDKILSAVAAAGKASPHTEEWARSRDWLEGKSYADLIQEAANELAATLQQKEQV